MNKEQNAVRVCPKTGKPIEAKSRNSWKKWLFPITGLLALIWFLIRVIPKPSRASYPCQRAAMPLASGFIIWVLSITGFGAAVVKGRKHFRQSRWLAVGLCVVIAAVGIFGALNFPGKPVNAAFTFPDRPNTPVGVAKGIYPGRVTFLRDARACTYNNSGNYWDNAYVNQSVIDSMISKSIQSLTGKTSDSEAWDALFKFYNQNKSGQSIGYQAGEKIIIKVNNNVDNNGTNIGKLHANTPQVLYGLVKQLLSVGVKGANITIIDASRYMGSQIVDKFANDSNAEIKAVRFVAKGRINPVGDTSQPIYFSAGNIPNAGVPTDYIQAKYMINCALLRPHAAFGITFCGKNNFGSTYFPNNGGFTPSPMHTAGMAATYGKYSPIVDLMGHNQLGGKTFLYFIDGIYGCRSNQDNVMQYPSMGGWPSCILTSQDPVAIDSVCADYLANESSVSIGATANAPDDYLHEAAQANSPPSGTVYDPNRTGRLASLGVHEHWNNATDKKYTRNLGTGNGIELLIVSPSQTTPTPTSRFTPTPTRPGGPTPTPIPGGSISIAVGSTSAVGSFQADQYYSGGSTYRNSNTVDVSQITSNPPPAALFNNERYGAFSYTIPGFTAGNSYEVTLYFAETYLTSSGRRLFNVSINGAAALSNFDIYAAAGGQNRAIARSFTSTASSSGQIVIQFTNGTENAKINGISINSGADNPTPTPGINTPTPTPVINTPTPTRIIGPTPTPGNGSISIATGSSSAVGGFQADQYYSGGSTYRNSNTIDVSQITSNPPPAALFNNERYGAFSYTIPGFTAGSSYTVTLYFAETYLTASGRRLFNVSINSSTVLSSFDIYASAGGQNKAIARTFTTIANSSGQIVIQFTSGTENPKINGISIR